MKTSNMYMIDGIVERTNTEFCERIQILPATFDIGLYFERQFHTLKRPQFTY